MMGCAGKKDAKLLESVRCYMTFAVLNARFCVCTACCDTCSKMLNTLNPSDFK